MNDSPRIPEELTNPWRGFLVIQPCWFYNTMRVTACDNIRYQTDAQGNRSSLSHNLLMDCLVNADLLMKFELR